MPGIIGSTGWDRSSAWIWLFSSTHSTTAFSGGLWYSPTTSTTFSTNSGSVDSLKVSCRCGLRSNSLPDPPDGRLATAPMRAAIDARDQCVALPASAPASPRSPPRPGPDRIDGGRPGRGLVDQPVQPALHEPAPATCPPSRLRHPSFAATCLLASPSAHASTIRDRNANACDDFARRAHRTNCARSSSVNTNSAFGRPVLAIHRSLDLYNELQAQDTSGTAQFPWVGQTAASNTVYCGTVQPSARAVAGDLVPATG